MNRRLIMVGVVLMLVALLPFIVWPFFKGQTARAVSAALQERTKAVVERNAALQADWDRALEDGVLTWPEANAILEKVGEKADPEP
jgi:hypothetical protein